LCRRRVVVDNQCSVEQAYSGTDVIVVAGDGVCTLAFLYQSYLVALI
jgi:hypothetical protein